MALSTQGPPYVGGNLGWEWDDAACDHVPVAGPATPIDLTRGIGRLLTGGLASRALVNQTLPPGLLFVQSANGPETNTFTSRTIINNAALLPCFNPNAAITANTIPAGFLNVVGRTIRVRATGTLGTTGTPTFTFDFALGAAGATVISTTGSLTTVAVTSPNSWTMETIATVQSTGAAGTIIAGGFFNYGTATNVTYTWPMGSPTRGTAVTVDLTAAQLVSINATCGTSSASNRVICNTFIVELLY